MAELKDDRLEVPRLAPTNPCPYVVLRLAKKTPGVSSPVRLLHLRLTASEADVLCWAAHGKSNQEVAIILGKTLNTVKSTWRVSSRCVLTSFDGCLAGGRDSKIKGHRAEQIVRVAG